MQVGLEVAAEVIGAQVYGNVETPVNVNGDDNSNADDTQSDNNDPKADDTHNDNKNSKADDTQNDNNNSKADDTQNDKAADQPLLSNVPGEIWGQKNTPNCKVLTSLSVPGFQGFSELWQP
ncbi:uncharacterized protein DDB_G0267764-like [Frankliniella occidentalis]|uniref:Uncharacterized protein DDB_G0267764-like n=1 Tax=Frankliniella occidentalis TaxID=133901 RepID=A0A9C6X8C3_FRAOC|nr:uncharacterized protein DDB_G0267764-like [Frankliniella occidentalis]